MERFLSGMFVHGASALPLSEFAFRMLGAFVIGQLIGRTYTATHQGLSYSQAFVQAQVLLTMVVAVVMAVVGDNLARAFGLGAALAIVRFRTPVKDARDTTFLFLSVACGMAAGGGMIAIALIAVVMVAAAALALQRSSYGARMETEGLLRFRFSGDASARTMVQTTLGRHCAHVRLAAVRSADIGDAEELAYDIDLREPDAGDRLVRELGETGAVSGVTLLSQARVGEG